MKKSNGHDFLQCTKTLLLAVCIFVVSVIPYLNHTSFLTFLLYFCISSLSLSIIHILVFLKIMSLNYDVILKKRNGNRSGPVRGPIEVQVETGLKTRSMHCETSE
jgi:hypothetical protein